MEDKTPNKENDRKDDMEELMKCIREAIGLNKKQTIPNFPINKKIQKKYLKDHFSKKNKKDSYNESDEEDSDEDKTELVKKTVYPSGIIKITTKNIKDKIINEVVEYKDLKEKYINNIKENVDKELIRLIENTFLLYNRRQIIRNLVKKPYSTKVLEEKILLWKYYIKNLSKEEKALLLRKLLYYIGKFSENLYSEFINIKEISKTFFIFLLKGKKYRNTKESAGIDWNKFYMMKALLGYDEDGDPLEENSKPTPSEEEMKATILLYTQFLNVKDELNGTGVGFIFLQELQEIADMYTDSSYIFKSVFFECYGFIEIENLFIFEKIEMFRILWNFFAYYFIDDPFIRNIIIELKNIFAIYKQDYVVKFIHDLVLYRWNTNNILKNLKGKLEEMLGPEEVYDEKEKVEKMNNDDVIKYIEGDGKPKKKKKKKKKKNENKTNNTNQIEENKDGNEINNNEENDIDVDFDDSLSIISEADSVLDSFKNDILEETMFNSGNKITPQLSSQFLKQFQK